MSMKVVLTIITGLLRAVHLALDWSRVIINNVVFVGALVGIGLGLILILATGEWLLLVFAFAGVTFIGVLVQLTDRFISADDKKVR